MSNCNRIALAALGGIALALFGPLDRVEAQRPSAPIQQAESGAPAQQPESTAPVAAADPTSAAPYAPDCAKPKDHDEADYCSQAAMAKSAKETLDTAHFAVTVAFIDSLLLFGTLIFTWMSAETARRSLEGLERPFVFVEVERLIGENRDNSGKKGFVPFVAAREVVYRAHNVGRAPAIVNYVVAGSAIGPIMNVDYDDIRSKCIGESRIIGGEHLIKRDDVSVRSIDVSSEVSADDFASFDRLLTTVYIAGFMDYREAGGRRYRRHFMWSCIGTGSAVPITEKYNRDQRLPRTDIRGWIRRALRR